MEKSRKNIACAIGAFVGKYHKAPKAVDWPEWEFRMKSVGNPEIDETSLKECSDNLWTFSGTLDIAKTDKRATCTTHDRHMIVGSAVINFNGNFEGSKELLPEVKHVTITKIHL